MLLCRRGQHVKHNAFVVLLTCLHCGLFSVQLSSRVHGCSEAILVDELANVLHLVTAEVHVVTTEVRNGEALFERQAIKKSRHDHGLVVCAGHGRPAGEYK